MLARSPLQISPGLWAEQDPFAKNISAVDQVQVLAVIWIASCPAAQQRFPIMWCSGISWSPYINLDLWGRHAWDSKTQEANYTNDELQTGAFQTAAALTTGTAVAYVSDSEASSSIWSICAPALATLLLWFYFLFLQAHLKRASGVHSRFVPAGERLVLRLGESSSHTLPPPKSSLLRCTPS